MAGYCGKEVDDSTCEKEDGVDDIADLMSLAKIEEYLDAEDDAAGATTNALDLEDDQMLVPIPLAHDMTKMERSMDVQLTGENRDVTFKELGLRDSTMMGLKRCGFKVPSPIQLKAIPFGKLGYDLILQAKSGTGKTCAFGVVVLERLDMANHGDHIQALVVSPTREIAVQNSDVLNAIGSRTYGLSVNNFIGGMSFDQSIQRSKRCNIASGTPGRILHMIRESEMDLSSVQVLVLDEADKLMDSSFMNDVIAIIEALPAERQIIAASATYPEAMKCFLKSLMKNPMEVTVDLIPTLSAVTMYAADIPKIMKRRIVSDKEKIFGGKMDVLLEIIKSFTFKQAIVFCRCLVVEKVCEILQDQGYDVGKLSSTLDQRSRLAAVKDVQQGKCQILVSSDLGARGIDCEGVDLVINLEPPEDATTFAHRCGRTGRFGSKGVCITLTTFKSDYEVLERFAKSMKFQIRVFQTLQQIKEMGHGKKVKLDQMVVKSEHMDLTHPDNKDWHKKLAFFMNCDVKYPSLELDKLAGYKLNVDVDAIWKDVAEMRKRHGILEDDPKSEK